MDKWEYSTLHDKFNRLCAPNKKEDLNLYVFNMITGIMNRKHKNIMCAKRYLESC